ncbi:hypothetical protein [Prauserella endophytica]|uniref:DUF8017 domain-containing protein n=1 Tax=Prauserella endophytica TaxID=1592324 RepID=A0ABY2S6B6_9PSEU|nr:hypothetical protein [Prauserella endophytica]PXY21637.1 hypothetical protein BAY59_29730 [Prauserella coralliicola]TKG71419.1 hypothetical protein FCN18_11565 [Prauserella endophytica]
MGWWRRKPDDLSARYGYEDRAALKGIGGYEPADSADATPDFVRRSPQAPPPPEPPKPRPKRTKAPLAVVLLLTLLGGVISLARGIAGNLEDDEASSSAPPVTEAAPYTPEPDVIVPAVVEGWQSVAGGDGVYAYDVPPSWTPEPSVVHGWEADDVRPGITLAASAFTGGEVCDHRDRGGAGVTPVESADPASAARETAENLAGHAYTEEGGPAPTLDTGAPEQATVSFGGDATQPASITVVEVTTEGGGCLPDRALVAAIAVEPAGGSGRIPVLVAYADQDYAGAPTRDELLRILQSLRSVPEEDRTTVPATPTS